MVEEFEHPGEIRIGGAEEDIIEKMAPEEVAVNIEEEAQAQITAMRPERSRRIFL